jgi:hypothetical protein
MPAGRPTTKEDCEQQVRELLTSFGLDEAHIEQYWETESPFIGGHTPREALDEGRFDQALVPAEAAGDGAYA